MLTTGHEAVGYGQDGPAPRRAARRPPLDVALRFVLTLAAIGAALVGAAVLAFVALVVWQGCFISCATPDPQPARGLLAGCGALLTLVAGGWVALRVWRVRPATVHVWALLLAGGVAAYALFVAVATGASV